MSAFSDLRFFLFTANVCREVPWYLAARPQAKNLSSKYDFSHEVVYVWVFLCFPPHGFEVFPHKMLPPPHTFSISRSLTILQLITGNYYRQLFFVLKHPFVLLGIELLLFFIFFFVLFLSELDMSHQKGTLKKSKSKRILDRGAFEGALRINKAAVTIRIVFMNREEFCFLFVSKRDYMLHSKVLIFALNPQTT